MPEFFCKLGTSSGDIIEKTYISPSIEALKAEVQNEGYHIFEIRKKYSFKGILQLIFPSTKKIPTRPFLIFNQQLSSLIKAGLPILQCLDILLERIYNPVVREIVETVRDKVKSGSSLGEAFEGYEGIVPAIYVASLYAGEKSGALVEVIRRYVNYMKMMEALKKKVISSLVYPAVLLILSIGLLTALVSYVIPRFEEFYAGFDTELPLITVYIINVSHFIHEKIIWIIISLILLGIMIRVWVGTSSRFHLWWDAFKLKIPLIGKLWEMLNHAQFARTLSTLQAGGIPLVRSLEVSSRAMENYQYSIAISKAAQSVKEGQPLFKSLEDTKIFHSLLIELTKVGEYSGALEEMLNNVAEFYEEDIEIRLSRILSFIEPAILIGMGILIGSILFSIYYPIFSLAGVAR